MPLSTISFSIDDKRIVDYLMPPQLKMFCKMKPRLKGFFVLLILNFHTLERVGFLAS
ncbi:hypothetical protein J2T17_004380 [Paenibacillus mucilaginosus]